MVYLGSLLNEVPVAIDDARVSRRTGGTFPCEEIEKASRQIEAGVRASRTLDEYVSILVQIHGKYANLVNDGGLSALPAGRDVDGTPAVLSTAVLLLSPFVSY